MKSTIVLIVFSIVLYSCSEAGNNAGNINGNSVVRRTDCELMEDYNRYLWLEATYESYIDNALRCFKLNSIGNPGDSCIRLWTYEEYSPDSTGTYYLNLFEFGQKRGKPYATYHNLEWKMEKEKQQIVTCIRKKSLQPKNGWVALKKQISESELTHIDTISIPQQTDDLLTDGGLLAMQYMNGESSVYVDFTAHSEFFNSKYKKIRKYYELIKLVKDEFSVNLFADHFGHDLFKLYSN